MREQYRDEGGSDKQQTVNIEAFSFAGFKLFAQKNNTDLFYSKYKSSLVPFAVFLIFKSARQSREQLIDDYVAIRT